MVKFKEDSYIIEIKTGMNPKSELQCAINDIITLMQNSDDDSTKKETPYFLLELLKGMIPDLSKVNI